MNIIKLRDIISSYKRHFIAIHREEIYKWRAVRCFQNSWDIEAGDFVTMLDRSLSQTRNLMDSGQYFPKRMLLKNADANPEFIRQLFLELYNEECDLNERIIHFRRAIKEQNERLGLGNNDYQDHRAVVVYLCLKYPERYYFYKFGMFSAFVNMVEYPYQPVEGKMDNILQFLELCNLINEEVHRDIELQEMHRNRLSEQEYFDSSFNILTQDIIYAAVRHIADFESVSQQVPIEKRLVESVLNLSPTSHPVVLKGTFTNYIETEKENRRLGTLGELLVMESEQERLRLLGLKLAPEHKSKSEGDGLGYDILSYDQDGREIFIEVKTTRHDVKAPFYITANELEKSIQCADQYYLFRLYHYDDKLNKATYVKYAGSMRNICEHPVLFKVSLEHA